MFSIEPAKLVTKAIMKNKRNITTIGRMLDLLFVIRLEFLLLIIVQYSSMWFNIVQNGSKLFVEEEHDAAVEVLVVGAIAQEVIVVGIELHLKLLTRLHQRIHI